MAIDISQGLYRAVLAIAATANRVITFPDRTFTVADNADLAADVAALATHAALTDTAHGGTAWAAWVPTWTNVTIGSAGVTARWKRVGKLVICKLNVTWAADTSASGTQIFSLPVTGVAATDFPYGAAFFFDSATGVHLGVIRGNSTTTAGCYVGGASFNVNATVPFTWGTNDRMVATFAYEAA